ncbi:MAG: hypothetical protein ACREQ3_01255 [Candidatus Binatia bacterium]
MEDHNATTFSHPMGISIRVCPRGHVVYVYVGHTCLSLRKEHFFDLAEVVRAAESHLLRGASPWQGEQKH